MFHLFFQQNFERLQSFLLVLENKLFVDSFRRRLSWQSWLRSSESRRQCNRCLEGVSADDVREVRTNGDDCGGSEIEASVACIVFSMSV